MTDTTMGAAKTFAELEDRIKCRPQEKQVAVDDLDPFSRRLLDKARKKGYVLHSSYGSCPKAVILSFTHSGDMIQQGSELSSIIAYAIVKEDVVLCEGRGPAEVLCESYKGTGFFSDLGRILSENRGRLIFNDSDILIARFKMATAKLERAQAQYGVNSPRYAQALDDYMAAIRDRDLNFCNNPRTGMIPLADSSSRLPSRPSPDSRYFQLVGLMHVHTGNIQHCLEEANIPYMAFIPSKRLF